MSNTVFTLWDENNLNVNLNIPKKLTIDNYN
jgi:hypothetical protein